jgi:hypothetical protein
LVVYMLLILGANETNTQLINARLYPKGVSTTSLCLSEAYTNDWMLSVGCNEA